jgi:photosystem II stability/assembly factor-like uncharacterized protein
MRSIGVRLRFTITALLAAGLWALLVPPAVSEEEKVKPKDQQIADIEKQITELNKKLADLKKTEAAAGPSVGPALTAEWIKPLTWRGIGPANMGGRITAISVFEADPTTYWVATASGGLLKTTNNGVTFEHQFDHENTVSIGDVCVAPSDRNVVWVGTGENNPRNSASYGDGVYKSTDGGKTWKNMGLKAAFQVGKVAVHPKDPNTVYVGALGRLYGPNAERGLFKTTNGGESWDKVLYVDDKTGVIDIAMHPTEPDTLLVAMYERQRDGFDGNDPAKKWGPGAGLHKTTDGGKTWKKLTKGLPTCQLGRIGLDYYRKDPNVVYAIVESEKIGMGTPPSDVYAGLQGENAAGDGARLTQVVDGGPAAQAGLKTGDVVTALGDKSVKNWEDLAAAIRAAKVGDKVKVKATREGKEVDAELTLVRRPQQGGGRGAGGGGGGGFGAGTGPSLGLIGEAVEDTGIRITQLLEGGSAEKGGLKEGDVVTSIAGHKVRSRSDLQEQLRDRKVGDKVKIQYTREGKPAEIELALLTRPAGGFGDDRPDASRPYGANLGGQRENVQDQQGPNSHEYGGVYKSTDGGESWTRVNSVNPRPMYFSCIRVDPSDSNHIYVVGVSLYRSRDGGKTFRSDVRSVHSDHHALWIDPKDGRHMLIGTDGGFYVTYDRMANWDHLNHLALGQFYHVAVDPRPRYFAYGGLQDNGTWGGPTDSRRPTGPVNEDWVSVGGGDGFVCAVDPNDPDLIYYESQNGGMARRNLRTGEQATIRSRAPSGQRYRFNWKTPFLLSNHNSRIYYCAGNHVFRSLDRGNDLRAISPEITRTKQGSGSALAESPKNPNVLWAGTDDGNLWVTRDGGKEWVNLTDKVGLPGPRWVATIEASRYEEGRAYVCFDGHRSDDDDPHVYVTEDYGQTWKTLRGNLPWGSTRCLREDIKNQNLLYCGTEFGAWVSADRGTSWVKFNNNLPTVAVHEFAQHPTAGEIVAATHGRSLWLLDVTPLRQVNKEVLAAAAHLFQPKTAARHRTEPSHGGTTRRYAGQNPPNGAQLYYSLGAKAEKVSLKVVDYTGKTVRELASSGSPGLHRVVWNLDMAPARPAAAGNTAETGAAPEAAGARGNRGNRGGGARQAAQAANQRPGDTTGQGQGPVQPPGGGEGVTESGETPQRPGGGGGRGGFGGQPVAPGMYRVVLIVDGKELAQPLRVEGETTTPTPIIADEDDLIDD